MFQSMNYIYEIYKTGSFSKAYRNLYLTEIFTLHNRLSVSLSKRRSGTRPADF